MVLRAGWTIVLAAAFLFGGCSMRPLAKIERTGTSRERIRTAAAMSVETSVFGVGGVFLSPTLRRDHLDGVEVSAAEFGYGEQAARWSHLLLLPLSTHAAEARSWGWPAVSATVPPEPLAAAIDLFATKAVLRAERLVPLSEALPAVDLLVMARVDYNLLEDRILRQPSGMRGSIGRTIEVTLECYDLKTGEPVWRSTKKSHAFGRHVRSADEEDSRAILMRQPGGEVDVEIKGVSISAPTFDEMLPSVLAGLVGAMMKDLDQPRRNPEFVDHDQ